MLPLLLACAPLSIDLRSEGSHSGVLDDACEDPSPIEVTIELERQLYDGCPWGEGDNLDQAELIVAARVEESQGLALDATICSLELAEVQAWYDDGFFLLLGDAVLAASHPELVDRMEIVDGLPRYAWSSVAGQPFLGEESGWCLGEDEGSDCEIPGAESWDSMQLRLASEAFQTLDGPLGVTWVTFGDNDWDDCAHGEMDLVMELRVGD